MKNIIKIDQEELEYSGMNETQFTGVKRGANGTEKARHVANATVYCTDSKVTNPNASFLASTTLINAIGAEETTIDVVSTKAFAEVATRLKAEEAEAVKTTPKPAVPLTGGPIAKPKV